MCSIVSVKQIRFRAPTDVYSQKRFALHSSAFKDLNAIEKLNRIKIEKKNTEEIIEGKKKKQQQPVNFNNASKSRIVLLSIRFFKRECIDACMIVCACINKTVLNVCSSIRVCVRVSVV